MCLQMETFPLPSGACEPATVPDRLMVWVTAMISELVTTRDNRTGVSELFFYLSAGGKQLLTLSPAQ